MSSGYSDGLGQQVIGSILISCIGESELDSHAHVPLTNNLELV